ncbi:class I SAM-dependent methyltransferase [Pseudorhodoferax sp.]|uniref:class I SAM-dependent methyltransferase n=1 Tax=Pseudorhodoferax sp. TaxID=1993553 RepID=UPI002DD6AB45|nr:class I SAM-dependent methyltransferase [Pseudorhodoferax sp.]
MTNSRSCPVCNTAASAAKLFLKQNIDPTRMSAFSFASRKLPEFMCHQLVQCPTCDLVYANEPPDQSVLAEAYHVSDFDSAQEADDAAAAYDKAVRPVLAKLPGKEAALEIGTGTGVFLETLKSQGFKTLVGVEPSSAAIAAAPAHRRPWIREAIFQESDFAPDSFDLICCFMTLEHVRDPHEIAAAASRLLKPGGAIALVTHDYRSGVNRLLGKRSPIIDIEHMQLFSPKSIGQLLVRNGFESVEVSSFRNRYALRYWMRLLPLAVDFKKAVIKGLDAFAMADLKLSFNVGNMLSIGYRPRR